MDRFGEWRPIEPAASEDGDEKTPSKDLPATPVEPVRPEANAHSVRLIGLAAAAVFAVAGVVIWMNTAAARPVTAVNGGGLFDPLASRKPSELGAVETSATGSALIVDVEGAVAQPGVQSLPSGSRIGDAIAAAGGYSPMVDVAAASEQLNLAKPLADGDKIHVPARGEAVAAAATAFARDPTAVGPIGAGAPINLNTASSDELDTLPGIGPVTAAKIIAAREEAPFVSVDELLSREVVGSSTFEKIKTLVTVAP